MRLFLVGVALLSLGAATADLADPPSAPPASVGRTPSVVVTAPEAAKVSLDEQTLINQGYKPEMRSGQKVFCRSEVKTGTRLMHGETCGTADQIKARTRTGREMTETAQRTYLNGR
jgi:hypothetical protein